MSEIIRCWGGPPIFVDYHDYEWGRPEHDDVKLFEFLILEGMQAGLSWITVLKKREAFREAFDGFDFHKVALYGDAKIEELMANDKIIRNRLKILAAINNAKCYLDIVVNRGSFDRFIWEYVDNTPLLGHKDGQANWEASTSLSEKISKDLKKLGFKFVGSTMIYAFMQATGIVNDHMPGCFVREELLKGST